MQRDVACAATGARVAQKLPMRNPRLRNPTQLFLTFIYLSPTFFIFFPFCYIIISSSRQFTAGHGLNLWQPTYKFIVVETPSHRLCSVNRRRHISMYASELVYRIYHVVFPRRSHLVGWLARNSKAHCEIYRLFCIKIYICLLNGLFCRVPQNDYVIPSRWWNFYDLSILLDSQSITDEVG